MKLLFSFTRTEKLFGEEQDKESFYYFESHVVRKEKENKIFSFSTQSSI
jgi:hypothetical protein